MNYSNKIICNNLIRFWYNNPIMSELLFGFNNQYGHINTALPNIDWSVDRDYEHLTLDDIICILKEEIDEKSYEDLSLMTYAPEFREFYKLNGKCKFVKFNIGPYDSTVAKNENIYKNGLHFYIPKRTCDNGVHKSLNTADIKWNVAKDYSVYKLIQKYSPAFNSDYISGSFIEFFDLKSIEHFTSFWYDNPLMNDLIKGLNKKSGNCYIAIPNIDYSIDRDYEHLTLDDIMKILKEENTGAYMLEGDFNVLHTKFNGESIFN